MTAHTTITAPQPVTIAQATVALSDLKRAAKLLRHVRRAMCRNSIPALMFTRVTILGGGIKFEATDLDQQIEICCDAETPAGTGSFLVAIETLHGFAHAAAGPVTIRYVEATRATRTPTVWLTDGELTVHARNLIPVEDYPESNTPHKGNIARWEMTPDSLLRMLRLSRHCISTEGTRYYLNGAFLTNRPGSDTLRVVTTDGHRLAAIDSDTQIDLSPFKTGKAVQPPGVIVPTCAVNTMMLILPPGGNEPVEITVSDNVHITVHLPGLTYDCRLIDGTYPDYTRVIPKAAPGTVYTLTRAALLRLTRAASNNMSKHHARVAVLSDETKTICLGGGSADDTVCLPCPVTVQDGATPTRISFDAYYLLTQSNVTPLYTVTATSEHDPATILIEDPDALFVLMPMRI